MMKHVHYEEEYVDSSTTPRNIRNDGIRYDEERTYQEITTQSFDSVRRPSSSSVKSVQKTTNTISRGMNRPSTAPNRTTVATNRPTNSNSIGTQRQKTPTNTNRKSTSKPVKYVSPFILNATRKAEERSRQALLQAKTRANRKNNEWDTNTSGSGLFDPTLKKLEIFRIVPRHLRNQKPHYISSDSETDVPKERKEGHDQNYVPTTNTDTKYTIRTQGVRLLVIISHK